MTRWIAAAAMGVCAWGQLDQPRMGMMIDANGDARPLYGVPGSVVIGDVQARGALSTGCSRQVCLVKTATAIVSVARNETQSTDAPPGPAIFALDGDAAFVYFPESKQMARWRNGKLERLGQAAGAEEVLAMRSRNGAIEFAVRRDNGVWIVRGRDALGALPDNSGPVLFMKDLVLFSNGEALMLRRPDGGEVSFGVTGAEALFALGDGYVEVRAGGSNYAVRVDPGQERLFLLPDGRP